MATSPGTYKGVTINPGTDVQVAAQMAAIDKGSTSPINQTGLITQPTSAITNANPLQSSPLGVSDSLAYTAGQLAQDKQATDAQALATKAKTDAEAVNQATVANQKWYQQNQVVSPDINKITTDAFAQFGLTPQDYSANRKVELAEIQSLEKQYADANAKYETYKANIEQQFLPESLGQKKLSYNEKLQNIELGKIASQIQYKQSAMALEQGDFQLANTLAQNSISNALKIYDIKDQQLKDTYTMNKDIIDSFGKQGQQAFLNAMAVNQDEREAAKSKLDAQNIISEINARNAATSGLGVEGLVDTPLDPNSSDILSQTGLSLPAFSFLTMGTSALTRMTASQRIQYMTEAENYLKKTGTDVATFRAQYSALSQTVQANAMRNNQANVAETELEATIANLRNAAQEAGLTSVKGLNAAKIFAGKELNQPQASTYKFHLEQLRNEFAMYNAALAGQLDQNGNIREINDADNKRAAEIIQEGFSAGSIDGFEKALKASMSKMNVVLKKSIDAQNKQVWNLFGVGENFKPSTQTTTSGVTNYSSELDKLANGTTTTTTSSGTSLKEFWGGLWDNLKTIWQ